MTTMRTGRRTSTGVAAALAGGVMLWSSFANAGLPTEGFADLAEKVSPAVVNIFTSYKRTAERPQNAPRFNVPEGSPFEEFFKRFGPPGGLQQQRPTNALGSGFIIDESGYVVTNNHVIEGADSVQVKLSDKRELDAEVVGTDPQTDIALLKITDSASLPYVEFGDSDKVRVGEYVVAVGNPFGLGGTVTAGIVSARGRDIAAGPYVDFIQTDASINRGNSGGPLFDLDGNVVGVNSAIYSPSGGSVGVGFAIPSNIAQTVVDQLKEHGTVERGWLGVSIQPVTPEIAEAMGLEQPHGALVADVVEDSPAAGTLRQGDVIIGFEGSEVNAMRELPKLVAATRPGTDAKLDLIRDGDRRSVEIKLGTLPVEKVAEATTGREGDNGGVAAEKLGATLARVTPEVRAELGLDDGVDGAVVTSLDPSGPAASSGLRVGDVIEKVGSRQVAEPADVENEVAGSERKSVVLLVNRGGDQRFVGVRLS